MQPYFLEPFDPTGGVLGPFGPKAGDGVENEFFWLEGPERAQGKLLL